MTRSLTSLVALAAVVAACTSATAPPPAAPPSATPVSTTSPSADKPAPLQASAVDALLRAAWTKEGLAPAARADDATYLRRVYLDVAGVIPTAEQAKSFLTDTAPDKRQKLVETLLASDRYVESWTNYWDRLLLGSKVKPKLVNREEFRRWFRRQLAQNRPYDKMVFDLLAATGRNGDPNAVDTMTQAMADAGAPMTGMASDDTGKPTGEEVNGAVNWYVKYLDDPVDLAGNASKIFLGVQIQCAQCHDHKTEKWKTADFQRFAACFAETRIQPIDPAIARQRRVEVDDTGKIGFFKKRKEPELKAIADSPPTALDGTPLANGESRRVALAKWMTAPENPWFAKAIVNRVWAHFMGRGFVDPVTDFRPSNPADAPEVLELLAKDFTAQGFDLKRLVRLITSTEAYQLAAGRGEKGAPKLWSRFRVEPLGSDELLDALVVATSYEDVLDKKIFGKTIEDVREQLDRQFTFLFDVDEDVDAPSFTGNVSQALFLMNGQASNDGIRAVPGSTVDQVLAMPTDDAAKVKELYLRMLSREPTADETTKLVAFVTSPRQVVGKADVPDAPKKKAKRAQEKAGPLAQRKQAYEDLTWAILNSSEFSLNH